jgi:hypothetical protein
MKSIEQSDILVQRDALSNSQMKLQIRTIFTRTETIRENQKLKKLVLLLIETTKSFSLKRHTIRSLISKVLRIATIFSHTHNSIELMQITHVVRHYMLPLLS